MGKIIEVDFRKKQLEENEQDILDIPVCDNPIITTRPAKNIIAIGFRLDCFEASYIDVAVKSVAHGQNFWHLYKAGRDNPSYKPMFVTYLAHVYNAHNLDLDAAFTQIIYNIVQDVYRREVAIWGSKTDISELSLPYATNFFDGLFIDKKTVALLRAVGLKTLLDVARLTREKLCCIPGMTTHEVVKLEKSLAVRGWYLNGSDAPKWKG